MKQVGILGGGQLARMLALAGLPLGVRCRVLDPGQRPPAADVAEHIRAEYDDADALARLASGADVITYELEHIPMTAFERLSDRVPIHPRPQAVAVAGDRVEEKRFVRSLGLATAAFAAAETLEQVRGAAAEIGLPLVIKTRTHGYDGRGQFVVRTDAELEAAAQALAGLPVILEAWVPFERELSVIAVRSQTGEVRAYPVGENRHRDGILLCSLVPAPDLDAALQAAAEDIARKIMSALDYVGVLTVELFQCGRDLIVNEIAPRVHNSGHWTIEGAATSQFENHLRAILALPLGSTTPIGASALVNLLGDAPALDSILALPDTHLHLYNKAARPRRKIGHVTSRAESPDAALRRIEALLSQEWAADGPKPNLTELQA